MYQGHYSNVNRVDGGEGSTMTNTYAYIAQQPWLPHDAVVVNEPQSTLIYVLKLITYNLQ